MKLQPHLLIRSLRLRTSLLTTGVFATIAMSLGPPPAASLVIATLCVLTVTAGGFAYNDYRDYHIDVLLRRQRPIALGQLPRKAGLVIACLLWLPAALAAPFLGTAGASIVIAAIALLAVYDRLKNLAGFLGNVATACLALLLILLSAEVASVPISPFTCAGLILPFMVGREILLDTLDVAGDSLQGRITLPARFGLPQSLASVTFIATFGCIFAAVVSPSRSWTIGIVLAYGPLLVAPLMLRFGRAGLRFLVHASWGSLALGGLLVASYLSGR